MYKRQASTGVTFTPIPLDQLPAYNSTGTTVSTGKTTTGTSVSGESKITTTIKKDISGFKKDLSSAGEE